MFSERGYRQPRWLNLPKCMVRRVNAREKFRTFAALVVALVGSVSLNGQNKEKPMEQQVNALPQFIILIDGLDIHFIHVRSKHANALPIIITHGWPGSLKIIGPLTDRTAHGRPRTSGPDVN